MVDLFNWQPPAAYPAVPGARRSDTSQAAADAMKPGADRLRQMVLAAIVAAGAHGLTADEAAERCGLSVLAARPRCSELKLLGKIRDAGVRRRNASGRSAAVWVSA